MARRETVAYADEFLERLARTPIDDIDFRFDEFSDTLYLSLTPDPQPAISVYISAGWMVRVHRDSDEVVGIQIENALSEANPFMDLARDTVEMMRERAVAKPHSIEQTIEHFSEAFPQLVCCY